MRVVILVLAFFVCMGDGQQLQDMQSHTHMAGKEDPLNAVATLLLALQPDAAFQPSAQGAGVRRPSSHSTLAAGHPTAGRISPLMDAQEDAFAKLDAIVPDGRLRPQPKQEEEACAAIFTHGSLRADYSADGDKYGIFKRAKAEWTAATITGYALYLEEGLTEPYVVPTGDPTDIVVGTMVTFLFDNVLEAVLSEINEITGWEKDSDAPIVERGIVDVAPLGTSEEVPAYLYFQPKAGFRSPAQKIESGDWLLKTDKDGNQISGFSADEKSGQFR
mmetsp:Transcript_111196/g.208446  ORF Transcript_111196/g.208446 Transcript_111196/m.208446 type:complete len:275 (+) Transcript_111196:65-889(+)